MATFTATEYNALRENPFGLNVVRSRFTADAGALTVSDVVLLARVPNGATLVDWKITGGVAGVTTAVWSLGLAALPDGTYPVDAISGQSLSADALRAIISLTGSGCWAAYLPQIASASQSLSGSLVNAPAWTSNPAKIPFKVSLSDGATPRWVWIQGSVSGSTTGTTSLQLVISYMTGE